MIVTYCTKTYSQANLPKTSLRGYSILHLPIHSHCSLLFIHSLSSRANMSASTSTTEGKMTWTVPNAGLESQTWYKITGNLKSNTRPLVILHGGPGVPSDYLFPLSFLSFHYYIPVLIYDQIGSGRSTHFPDKMGDTEFWTEQLFLDELKALLQHLNIYDDYDLLGHSWGGMLGSRHASRQPGGLKHLIIMSSPASMDDWIKAQEAHRRKLPQNVQDALDRCEKEGKTDSKEYQDAVNVYYSHHLCRVSPMPELLQQSFAGLEQDPTVYFTMSATPLIHADQLTCYVPQEWTQ